MKIVIYTTLMISIIFLSSCNECEPNTEGCENDITIMMTVTDEPKCGDCDGQITFINPPPGNATYKWSHDAHETGHNVSNLCAGLYSITVTASGKSRVTQAMVN